MSLSMIDKLMILGLFLMTWVCIWVNNVRPKEKVEK